MIVDGYAFILLVELGIIYFDLYNVFIFFHSALVLRISYCIRD